MKWLITWLKERKRKQVERERFTSQRMQCEVMAKAFKHPGCHVVGTLTGPDTYEVRVIGEE